MDALSLEDSVFVYPIFFTAKIVSCTSDQQRYDTAVTYFEMGLHPKAQDSTAPLLKKSSVLSRKVRDDGNKHFEHGRFSAALECYTESVALAPVGSEELPLAYANRSAVLKQMGRPRDALKDMRRALEEGYPEDRHYKLSSRRAQCLYLLGKNQEAREALQEAISSLSDSSPLKAREQLEKVQRSVQQQQQAGEEAPAPPTLSEDLDQEPPPLSYGVNPEMPRVSDCVKLCYTPLLGRHLVATRDIQIGDVVMVDYPWLGILKSHPPPHRFYSHCSQCLCRSYSLLPCPKCAWAMFCSEECREAAARSHAVECEVVPRILLMTDMDERIRLLLRVLSTVGVSQLHQFILANRATPDSDPSHPDQGDPRTRGFTEGRLEPNFSFLYSLQSAGRYPRPPDKQIEFCYVAWRMVKVLGSLLPDPRAFGGLLVHLQQILSCNTTCTAELLVQYNKENPQQVDKSQVAGSGSSVCFNLNMMNHSCNPNTLRIANLKRGAQVIQASQPIRCGTEVTASYYPQFWSHPRHFRRQFLRRRFNFDCRCDACIGNWPQLLSQSVLLPPGVTNRRNMCVYQRGEEMMLARVLASDVPDPVEMEMVARQVKMMWDLWEGRPKPCLAYFTLVNRHSRSLRMRGPRHVLDN